MLEMERKLVEAREKLAKIEKLDTQIKILVRRTNTISFVMLKS